MQCDKMCFLSRPIPFMSSTVSSKVIARVLHTWFVLINHECGRVQYRRKSIGTLGNETIICVSIWAYNMLMNTEAAKDHCLLYLLRCLHISSHLNLLIGQWIHEMQIGDKVIVEVSIWDNWTLAGIPSPSTRLLQFWWSKGKTTSLWSLTFKTSCAVLMSFLYSNICYIFFYTESRFIHFPPACMDFSHPMMFWFFSVDWCVLLPLC